MATKVRVVLDDIKAWADPALWARVNLEVIDKSVDVLVPITRAEAPSRTGRGRALIRGRTYQGAKPYGTVAASNKAFYLRILAAGTYKKPGGYTIEPKSETTKALNIKIGGASIFRRRVRHPGLRPDDFFDRAARRSESVLDSAAEQVIQRNLDQATAGG
jgi:hypothetical protein